MTPKQDALVANDEMAVDDQELDETWTALQDAVRAPGDAEGHRADMESLETATCSLSLRI